jgi:hypothetical protein
MKNFKWVMIIVVSICFIIGIVSLGWSAEMQMKPGVTAPIQVAVPPHCPPGFTMSATGASCLRTRPATPCPSGFTVVWGPCLAQTPGQFSTDPSCSFRCMPNMPAAGSYKLNCPSGYWPASQGLSVDACSILCLPTH